MRRPPLPVYILTIAVLSLAALMILEGLHGRVYGFFPEIKGWYWGASTHLADWLTDSVGCRDCFSAESLSWAILVMGLTWLGALVAFWLRLSWAARVILILGVFSLAFWIPGIFLTLVVIIALWLKPTRQWFNDVNE
jgi:hypothetical protein